MLNVQADLIARLAEAFPAATVAAFPPDPLPPALIIVRREGGRRLNRLLDRPGVGIWAFAGTEAEACGLAEAVADFMERLAFGDGYAVVEQEAMRSAPDPDTLAPRWYLSYTITTYEPEGDGNGKAE